MVVSGFMRYLALACDYDGTLATAGKVSGKTVTSLELVAASGRRLVLVTGRELNDLASTFDRLDLFEYIVAENGAVLHQPGSRTTTLLGALPPAPFVDRLRASGVDPLFIGRVIVATREPHEKAVLDAIRDLGLELQVIFNKGAVMVLPAGVNKATGLLQALARMQLSTHNVVGIGDAENDHAFITSCEFSVAVANALPVLKDHADFVTDGHHGAGVEQLIEHLVADDLRTLERGVTRHDILLGTDPAGENVSIHPYRVNMLAAGPSGSGKSTLSTALLERLAAHGYQFCVIDPEGDYETHDDAVSIGDQHRAPSIDEVIQLLEEPSQSVAVNLLGLKLEDRPAYFASLLTRLLELRMRTGRPHCLVVDEAHHLFPSTWDLASLSLPQELDGLLLITVHPETVSAAALGVIERVVAVGENAGDTIAKFCKATARPLPGAVPELQTGEVLFWRVDGQRPPVNIQVAPGSREHRRHQRKYAEGDLGEDRSFYFRGPEGKLNLRAQNLGLFLQLADGVDDGTWLYHLRRGDYTRWFREVIKDERLAEQAARLEHAADTSATYSRERIRAAIEAEYTMPESGFSTG
jgi:hydroxymethylpyrimidine pyrophosphatase-like HAD family hydrolase